MNNRFSELFIRRPVATTLLTIGIAFAGLLAFGRLPVSPLPQVDFATISVSANMPGASPDNMASAVAAPLEKHLGQIADVTEMSSQSTLGNARVTLQFGLDRDIDGAARDVQAAINAARADLPTSLRQNPSYHKFNPADAPIMVLSLTSTTRPLGELYDVASNVLQQRLSQLEGIGEVDVTGSALPGVRVELNPGAMFHYGIGLEDLRAALASANANSPKGAIEDADFHYQIYANDQATKAAQYRDLVVAYRNNAPVKLSDVAEVVDSVEDLRNAGLANGKPAIGLVLSREPGANIIQAVDRVKAELPRLIASLPGDVDLTVVVDRSITIRGSLKDTEKTLITSVGLVILVVFVFLRDVRASAIPSVAVPVSIIGSFAAMYLLGFSLNNLSLMALTISTGFVVDDAIVVLENITRHIEEGKTRLQAAILGAGEVGFTVISISLSLIAVFLPLLLMGGLVGRLFREFTVTLSMAVLISLVVSLTTTPMMCAYVLPRQAVAKHGRIYNMTEAGFDAMLAFYRRTLSIALRHPLTVVLVLFATIGLNVWLFGQVSYSLFPVQDTGLIVGSIQGDQSISFQAMTKKLAQLQEIVQDDPAVATVVGVTGGRQVNSGFIYSSLKPFAERQITADGVVARLRGKLAQVAGARLYLVAVSDLRTGGRQSNATYQYTLLSDDTAELYKWGPRLTAQLMKSDVVKDVNSDQQQGGLEADVNIDRATSMRLGLTISAIDNTLYDAFGQRQVSTIYNALNQYHVVMEVAPRYWQDPSWMRNIWASTSGANPTGTQSTNASAANYSAPTAATSTAASIAADAARNLATNSLAASGHSSASTGSAVSTSVETMISVLGVRQSRGRSHAAQRQSPGSVPGLDDFVQSGAGQGDQRRAEGDRGCGTRHRHAVHRARRVRGHRRHLATGAIRPARSDRRGAARGIPRAGNSLRELYSSHHHHIDAAFGKRRRADRAQAVQYRIHDNRLHRDHSLDRHRQEERDHDDRFRAAGRARGSRHEGSDHAGVPAALSADHDDDVRGDVRRAAARVRHGGRLGIATSARDNDRRRPAVQPGADPLYDTGDFSVSRSFW